MPGIHITLRRDDISPDLERLASDNLRQRILNGVGTLFGSLAQRAFDEPSLRAKSWPARKSGGSNPLLIKSGDLRQSIHSHVQGDSVVVGSPKAYAAVHQLGSSKSSGRGSGIPARPFFPIDGDELTANAREEMKDIVDALIGER